MVITLTLGTISAFIGSSALGGFIGNRVDAMTVNHIIDPVLDGLKPKVDQNGLPVNEHLGRMLKKASLFASQALFEAFLSEAETMERLTGEWPLGIENDAFRATFDVYLNNQEAILELPYPELEHDEAYGRIEGLLAASSANQENIIQFRNRLSAEIKSRYVVQLQQDLGLNAFPAKLNEMIINGWFLDGKFIDWFELMALKFAALLKDSGNAEAQLAFQMRLLSDIKIETENIRLDMAKVLNDPEKYFPKLGSIEKLGPKLDRWIKTLKTSLKQIDHTTTETFVIAQRSEFKIDDLKNELITIRREISSLSTQGTTAVERKSLNILPQYLGEVIGRNEDLELLNEDLVNCESNILIKGIGGIGKSTFLKAYLRKYREQFNHIVFFEFSNNEELTLSDPERFVNLVAGDDILIENLGLTFNEDATNMFKCRQIMFQLQNIPGLNLMVIDNADESVVKLIDIIPSPPTWRTLISSREEIDGFQTRELTSLSPTNTIKLFRYWHPAIIDEEEVGTLLKLIDYHTLMTELISKTITASKGFISVSDIELKFRNHELHDPNINELIKISKPGMSTTLFEQLIMTFDMAKFSDAEISTLKYFYYLPSEFYEVKLLAEWLNIPEKDLRQFNRTISQLSEKGWLYVENNSCKMHRLIQEMIFYKLNPSLKDVQPLLQTFYKLATKN
ncbi:hypothetical protein IDJ77_26870 [Mucilaginibacter sp. ZT4R22]|uniref:NB-ARC domain-containing protein n=1 Tax=Mucilaginibacter pankratovii TaxID=2772110 RepID=A0ABR7WYV0_9SPHI|nr:hypothetical protein [Mucilaginibacter pankratovii]MBD1367463.1 hypothetical protein [Mucilaginibacter pankratovii]